MTTFTDDDDAHYASAEPCHFGMIRLPSLGFNLYLGHHITHVGSVPHPRRKAFQAFTPRRVEASEIGEIA